MTDTLRKSPRDLTLLARIFVVLAIFVSVGVFDLGSQKPFDIVKFSTVWFFGWLAFGAWIAQVVRRRERAGTSVMTWFGLAFVASSAVSTILSPTKITALFGWYGRYTGLVTICVLVAVYNVIAHVYRDRPDRVRELFWALSAGAFILIFYILLQWLNLDPIKWSTTAGTIPGLKYFGTMGNADFAGGYLGLTAPCVFYAFGRSDTTWKRVRVGIWGLAQLWTLWLTSARNGIAALGVAVIVLGVCAILVYVRGGLRIALVAALVAVAVVIAAIAGVVIVRSEHGSAKAPTASVLRSDTVKVRAYWWIAGLRLFEHHPVFGTGPDTYVSEYEQYLPAKAAPVADSEIADKPHNVFIDHLATQGIVGTGLYLALLVLAFVLGYRRLRDGPPGERLVLLTLLALMGAYVGEAFFSIDVVPLALSGWVILGAITALVAPPKIADARVRARKATAATAAVLALSVVLATIGTFPLIADHEAHTAQRLTDAQAGLGDVVMHYDRARHWQPFEPIYPGAEGDYLEKQATSETDATNKRDLLQQSVAYYRKMLSLQPSYSLWMMTLGKGIGDLAVVGGASFDESQRWFKRATVRAPYDWRVPSAYGDMLFQWARTSHSVHLMCRAYAEYDRAVHLRDNEPAPWLGIGKSRLALGQLKESLHSLRRAARLDRVDETGAVDLLKSTQELIAKHKTYTVAHC